MLRISWLYLVVCTLLSAGEPQALYLTWVDDPTTTMTVVWFGEEARVLFREQETKTWSTQSSTTNGVSYLSHLKGLKENTTYLFKLEGSQKTYQFRTLPETLSREVRFAVGGDIYYYWGNQTFQRMNYAIAYDDPDFVVLGGDIAYTTGSKRAYKTREWELERWINFFHEMQETMTRKDGRMIPMIPAVGNHDVHRKKRDEKELFYQVFPFSEEKAYRNIVFGNYLDLILLDTGHTSPVEGAQTEWLEKVVEELKTPYVFAVYHVAAYPSHYEYDRVKPEAIRKLWVPLFEKGKLSGVFEHHSHAFKKTHPLKEGKIDPNGVVYYGDGSWGVPPREVHKAWYLEIAESINACWFIHLNKTGAIIEARTETGAIKATEGVKK